MKTARTQCGIPGIDAGSGPILHLLAIALVAMWQLEAIQTVGDGTGGVIDAATIAEEQRFMDFTLPDLRAE